MQRNRLEITKSEMLELRKQGMSNKDIAATLEISLPTVYKYIGKQMCRMDSVTRDHKQPPPPAEVPRQAAAQVQVVSQVVAINGFVFDINMAERTFLVQHPYQQHFGLRADAVEDFKAALDAVKRIVEG